MNKKKLFNSFYFTSVCKLASIIPLPIIQLVSNRLIEKIIQNHSNITELLEDYGDPTFLIFPTDFPLVFKFKPCGETRYLTAYRKQSNNVQTDATIKGSCEKLFDLMEGKVDGDALFFSRDISISGKTEIVVALRNAIENAEIDIFEEILESCKPLKDIIYSSNNIFTSVRQKIDSDLHSTRYFFFSPIIEKLDELERKINLIEQKND